MENSESVLLGFAAAIGGAYFSLCIYLIHKSARASEIGAERIAAIDIQLADANRYEILLDQVFEERNQITLKLKQISDTSSVNQYQTYQGGSHSFFTGTLPIELLQERVEVSELVNRLFISLEQYPRFSRERADNDPTYYSELYEQLSDHHKLVTILAKEYFQRVINAGYQESNLLNTPNV